MKAEIAIVNIEKRNNQNRLSGNEILFLWSLLVNKEDFWHYPEDIDDLYKMRCEIPRLMDELHLTFFSGVASHVQDIINGKQEESKPYYDGAVFQEAIFYSGGHCMMRSMSTISRNVMKKTHNG